MGLIFDVLSAVNNPKQLASVENLSSIFNSVQQLAGNHSLDATGTQSVISTIGNQLRSSLKQQATTGNLDLGGLINQFTGGNPNLKSLQSLIPESAQQQLLQGLTQKLGLNSGSAQGLIGGITPILLNLLHLGSPSPGSGPLSTKNPLLTSFLDSDHDGDVDLGDAFRFISRFLHPPIK